MEKILLITMGWLFVVGGAIVLGALLEYVLHQRKSKRLDANFDSIKSESPQDPQGLKEAEREFRRSA